MSRRNRYEQPTVWASEGCRIVSICSVTNPVFRAFAHEYHTRIFNADDARVGDSASLDIVAARKLWNSRPDKIREAGAGDTVGVELNADNGDEMPDVDAFVAEMMSAEVETYNETKRDMYTRDKMALSVDAVAMVVTKAGDKVKVTGQWPTLSAQVPLHIQGIVVQSANAQNGNVLHVSAAPRAKQQCFIFPSKFDYVTSQQFYQLLLESGADHRNVCLARVRDHFDASDPEGASSESAAARPPPQQAVLSGVVVHRTYRAARAAQHGSTGAASDPQTVKNELGALYNKRVEMSTLMWRMIQRRKCDVKKMLKAPFPQLGLRLMLMARELNTVRDFYNGDASVALDACSRGPAYLDAVAKILKDEPHVLCFRELRRRRGKEKNTPALELLPDLEPKHFVLALQEFVAPEKQSKEIIAAVNIYHSILRRDVFGSARYDSQYTSGNMFSVFGAHEMWLKDRFYHEKCGGARGCRCEPDDLRDADTLGQMGRFTMPDDDDDFDESAEVDIVRRRMLKPDRDRLTDMGLHGKASTDIMVGALRWLEREGIVVRRRFIGTGPENRGKPFDAFFLRHIHDASQSTVKTLCDIVKRATQRKQRRAVDAPQVDDATLVALRDMFIERREEWRSDWLKAAARERARDDATAEQSNSVGAAVHSARQTGSGSAPPPRMTPAQQSAAAERNAREEAERSPVAQLARKIASDVQRLRASVERCKDRLRASGCTLDDDDPYADVRAGTPLYRQWPLLVRRAPTMTVQSGAALCEEQRDAVRRLMSEPITVLTGMGGVGKTAVLKATCDTYSRSQVVCCALTAQVAAMMTERTGFEARTVHSLLFEHARYLEAQMRADRFRAAAHRKAARSGNRERGILLQPDEVAECVDIGRLRDFAQAHLDGVPPRTSALKEGVVLIIEETSLLAFPLFEKLLRAAHNPARGTFLEKIIFVGDLDQLPSIDYGNVQSDLAHGIPGAVAQLVINHRSHGTELFSLAQAIAERRFHLPMPKFTRVEAIDALKSNADIVAFDTSFGTLEARIRVVYKEIGAFRTDDWHAAQSEREQTQLLTATNEERDEANRVIRWHVHGEPQVASAASQTRLRKFMGYRNADEHDARDKLRAEIEARDRMRAYIGDLLYVSRNKRTYFAPRPNTDDVAQCRVLRNGEVFVIAGYYETPRRITKAIRCRCGLCPPDAANCMARLDRPPPLRCAWATPETSRATNGVLKYQDHKWSNKPAEHRAKSRRMVVLRAITADGRYEEEDVEKLFARRNEWDFANALTTHKKQGSEVKRAVYALTKPKGFVTWRALYTAVTRAVRQLVLLSNESTLRTVARRREPVRRSALWYDLQMGMASAMRDINNERAAELERIDKNDIAARWAYCERLRYRSDVPRAADTSEAAQTPAQQSAKRRREH